ncbi:MAG: PQQ-dependent sugar dehydrogenase [Actinomycetota bacterium]
MIRLVGAPAAILLLLACAPAAHAADPETVAGGLQFPAGIAFDSDGTMFVTEREGRMLAFEKGRSRVVATVQTTTSGEAGLLGIAVSPDDRFVYAFATAADGASNVVYRVRSSGGDPEIVVDGLTASSYHNGGGVAFGDDGMLYVSNGEGHETSRAQDPDQLGGKVYRFTPEGRVPADNPFGNSPAYAIGLRNPFGLAIDPVSGAPFVTENGPTSHDEINRIDAGGNYGWPITSGPATEGQDTESLRGDYHDPLLDYEAIIVPTGIAFADPDNAQPRFRGDLFFATFGDQTIHRVSLNEQRDRVVEDKVFFQSPEPVIALAWGPKGLYLSTPGSVKLFRLVAKGAAPGTRGSLPTDFPSARFSIAGDAPPRGSDEGFPTALFLVGGAVLLVAGALAFAFWPRHR